MAVTTVEWYTSADVFESLAADWEALALHERSPFLRPRWFSAWWSCWGSGTQIETPVVTRDGQVVAIFPLARRGRTLVSLAAETAWDYRPLANDPQALENVLDAAFERDADEIVVHGLAGDTDAATRLRTRAAAHGRLVVETVVRRAPYVRPHGTFDDYLSSLDADFRRESRRRRRKLEADHAAAIDPVGLDVTSAALDAALALEASGWKGADGGAVLASPELTRFYRTIADAFRGDGGFRLPRIEADGRTVAMMFAFEYAGRVTSLRSAYDESLRKFGLGVLLKLAVLERCFADGLEELDLQGDAAPWKLQLRPAVRDYLTVRAYRRSPRGLARLAWRRGALPVKRRAAELAGRRSRTPAGARGS